jgi:hypothetical protein
LFKSELLDLMLKIHTILSEAIIFAEGSHNLSIRSIFLAQIARHPQCEITYAAY